MSNRVYDEATLLQAVALANAAAQLQHQSSEAQMEMPDLFPALSAMSQTALLDLLQHSSSQVPEYRETDLEPAPSEQSMAELPQEPPPLQAKAASSAEPLISRPAAPRSKKKEHTAETFRRGCARLRTIQETEQGRLFASRSQWNDLRSAMKQTLNFLGKQLSLWKTAIQTVEAKHGSNVSLTLYFLRFALGINAALFLFWLGGTVIPFIISPPATFSWSYFQTYKPLDLLQGYGLHNTFLLYGGYNYGDTVGGDGDFRLDISFPLELVASFFFSLVMLLSTIHKRLQGAGDSAFVGQNKLFPFSTVVFTSWDYHLTDVKAARNLRNSIRNQLAEMAFGLVIVWPIMVGGTAVAVYLIVTNQDAIARTLGFSFASTVALSLINVISTLLVHMTVVAENWHPRQRTNVEALKLLSIKLINTSTFVYQLYRIQTAASGESTGTIKDVAALQGHCLPGCAENAIGLYFYRLLLTNMVTLNLVDILMACMYRLLGMAVTFDPPSVVIAIIDTEILVWLGSMYAPLLPLFGLLSNVVTFNTKRFLSLYLYTPPQERYSASRTNVVVYTLMLGILTGCSVPMVFNLQYGRKYCGPHQGISMTSALSNAVSQGPRVLANILTWAVSPFVLGGLCVVLGFFLLVTQGQRAHFKKDKEHLRMEFEQYRHQMQAKVVIARKLKGRTLSTVSESSSEGSGEVRITAIAHEHVERSGPSGPVSRLASTSNKAVHHSKAPKTA
ncbi:Transmembrane channel-like protein 7 [Coccomyxa sp. Obi]|nr:Transmembrane channel-like protein 7 [Coccomyxa sp. Obi]